MMGWTQDRQRLEVWRLAECLCDHVDLIGRQTSCDGLG